MPQEFQVLQCHSCRTFQGHQVKKALKWACKLCGEKQSIVKVYGRGTGAECRQHVQRLNTLRGELDEVKCQAHSEKEFGSGIDHCMYQASATASSFDQAPVSKWGQFIEEEHKADQEEDTTEADASIMYTTDASLFSSQRSRKRRGYQEPYTNSKKSKGFESTDNVQEGPKCFRSKSSTRSNKYNTSTSEMMASLDQTKGSDFVKNDPSRYQRDYNKVDHYFKPGAKTYEKDSSKWGAFLPDYLPLDGQSEESTDCSQSESASQNHSGMSQLVPDDTWNTQRTDKISLNTTHNSYEETQYEDYSSVKDHARNLSLDKRILQGVARNNDLNTDPVVTVNNEKKLECVKASKWSVFISDDTEENYSVNDTNCQEWNENIPSGSVFKKRPVSHTELLSNNTTDLQTLNNDTQLRSCKQMGSSYLKILKKSPRKFISQSNKCSSENQANRHSPKTVQNSSVNTKSLFSLGDLSDEDLVF